jgi:hypothetical protein
MNSDLVMDEHDQASAKTINKHTLLVEAGDASRFSYAGLFVAFRGRVTVMLGLLTSRSTSVGGISLDFGLGSGGKALSMG